MTNLEIIKTLVNVFEPATVQDEAIKQAVLALLDQEGEEKPQPKPKAAPKKPGRKAKPFDLGKALACKKAGWSVEKIADELGCSTQTVYTNLRNAGKEASNEPS